MFAAEAQHQLEKRRQPMKRKCIRELREKVTAVPQLGDVAVFLKADRRAQDAMYTLVAMGYKTESIADYVALPRFDHTVVLAVLSASVTRQLASILKGL